MSDEPHPEDRPDDPLFGAFGGVPFLGDMMRALSAQGPLNWDAARQFAQLSATGGTPEHNVDPTVRPLYADLARIAAMHVDDVLGRDTEPVEPELVTPGRWAQLALEDHRPLFTELATSLASAPNEDASAAADPFAQMMANLNRMMTPALLGMTVGSMVGTLAQRVFGTHDLPIPRERSSVLLVPSNIERFATEWSIAVDEMRLWVLAHELAGRVLFGAGQVREPLMAMIRRHVGAFRPDPEAVAEQLGTIDPGSGDPMAALQQAFSDPTLLLGAVQSPEQAQLAPSLDAAVAAVVGFTDWVVDAVAVRVIGGNALTIADAVRRQRAESTSDDVVVERLLGVRVGTDQVHRGKQFVQGIVDRAGETALGLFTTAEDPLPTVNEIDAPGLWLARVTGD